MKKKMRFKLFLDVLLTLMLVTLYSKNFFGIHYHEVMGIAILIPILIHILINVKTVYGMCKNFTRVPRYIRICLIVDILLFLNFVWMGISGVLISKTIFVDLSTTNVAVKLYHLFFGGMSVILLGIHIGLHICRKEMKKWIAVTVTILALAGGIYGICSSEMVRWIGMPFAVSSEIHREENREFPQDSDKEPGHGEGKGLGNGAGKGLGKGPGNGTGKGLGNGGQHGQLEMSLLQKANVYVQFMGMIFSSAMITYWLVIWKKKQ